MSQKNKKRETMTTITRLLLPVGAIAITIFAMFFISFSTILLTGVIMGGNQPGDVKYSENKKRSGMVIIAYSNAIENEVRKSQSVTPELPLHFRYQKQVSLSNFQLSYRY